MSTGICTSGCNALICFFFFKVAHNHCFEITHTDNSKIRRKAFSELFFKRLKQFCERAKNFKPGGLVVVKGKSHIEQIARSIKIIS